jgi:hypothetical protein
MKHEEILRWKNEKFITAVNNTETSENAKFQG